MHPMLAAIQSKHIPTDFIHKAAEHLGLVEERPEHYTTGIKLISGEDFNSDNYDILRKTYAYLVVGVIQELDHTDKLDGKKLLATAEAKATKLVTDNPWMFARPEAEPKLDANGHTKPRKGAKKELAKQIYAEQIEDKGLSRKEAIAILVEEVDMSPAGASTYYANLKKGTL